MARPNDPPAGSGPGLAALAFGLTLAVCAGTLLYNLDGGSLPNSDDPIYASIAKEQADSGRWLEHRYLAAEIFEKPPLFFWLAAASIRTFGPGDFPVRLPAALASLLLLTLVYLLAAPRPGGRHMAAGTSRFESPASAAGTPRPGGLSSPAGVAAGAVAACFLLGTGEFFFNSRRVMTDLPFWLFALAFLASLARAVSGQGSGAGRTGSSPASASSRPAAAGPSRVWLLLSSLCMALAVLTKGPAFGPVAAAALLFLLLRRSWRSWTAADCLVLLLPALLVAGPWHAYMAWQHGTDFLGSYLGYHAVARVTSSLVGPTGPGFYLDQLVTGEGWHWALLMLAGLLTCLWHAVRGRSSLDVLLALFVLLYAALISFMGTRLPHYVLPLYAISALYVGRMASRLLRAFGRPLHRGICALVLLALLSLGFASHNAYHLVSGDYSPDLKKLALLARDTGAEIVAFNEYNVVSSWYAGVPVRAWSTDPQLCDTLRSIDMLRRCDFTWCPGRSAAVSEAIAAKRPAFLARRASLPELLLLLPPSVRGSYRTLVSGASVALLPVPRSTSAGPAR